ncbi:MAG TPA: T9SS type A sorting domain-containing protein, partial [Saprospiraceae bacterium]|nr:T9SS type A sorting domain-containing protein [Saprospiraceae bacterium]
LYPNPIKGQRLQLLSDEILTQYQINDLNGRVIGIGSFKNADTRYEIDVEQLPKGTYILNVFTLNRNSQVLTFIKN